MPCACVKQVPNLECYCVGITRSGGTIVSGWSDGKIRAFYPESGKLKFVISDAHSEGTTAVALAHDDDTRTYERASKRDHTWSCTLSCPPSSFGCAVHAPCPRPVRVRAIASDLILCETMDGLVPAAPSSG